MTLPEISTHGHREFPKQFRRLRTVEPMRRDALLQFAKPFDDRPTTQ
jgi:hypothetical protein